MILALYAIQLAVWKYKAAVEKRTFCLINCRETIVVKERLAKSVQDAMRAMARTERGANRRRQEMSTSPTLIVPDVIGTESNEVKVEGSNMHVYVPAEDEDDEDCIIVHEVVTRPATCDGDVSGQTADADADNGADLTGQSVNKEVAEEGSRQESGLNSPSEDYVAPDGPGGPGGRVEESPVVNQEEEPVQSTSPPVLSLPDLDFMNERDETNSPDGAAEDKRDESDSSAPGPNDTTVVLSSESNDVEDNTVDNAETRQRSVNVAFNSLFFYRLQF